MSEPNRYQELASKPCPNVKECVEMILTLVAPPWRERAGDHLVQLIHACSREVNPVTDAALERENES